MNFSDVPIGIKVATDHALENLDSLEGLGISDLLSLCIVIKYIEENPAMLPYQALRAIMTDVLDLLENENPNYGKILRKRFWEGITVKKMVSEGWWSEKTFYNHQRRARNVFCSLLWQKEQKCRSDFKIYVPMNETVYVSAQPDDNAQTTDSVRKNSSLRWVLTLTAFIIIVVSIWFFTHSLLPLFSQPTSTPTAKLIPETTFPTMPSVISTSMSAISVCGETEQIPVELGLQRFLRSQGLSSFAVENTPGLLNNAIRALAIDQTGLWIGYFDSEKNPANGLAHYDKKSLANCGLSKIMEGLNINALAVSSSGRLWVGTEKNGIAFFDGKEWYLYNMRDGLPSNEIFTLTIDDKDNVWAGTWEGVAKFDGTTWSVPYRVENDTIFNNHITAIAFDSEKNIWVGHIRDGVSQYRQQDSRWISYMANLNELVGNEVSSIIVRPKSDKQPESVWFATDGGISRFEQGKWTSYQVEDGLPSNAVSDLAMDRYGRIWVATDKGVSYFDGKIWKLYDSLNTTTIAIGSSCPTAQPCPFDDDQVLTGTPAMGFTHSRLPLPDSVIRVTKICFVTTQRERTCPSFDTSFDASLSESIITAKFPTALKPDETLRFEITVSPQATYDLRENRGDFISNTDADDFNLFKAWPSIGVKGTVEAGEPYPFTDYDNPFIAPKLSDEVQKKEFISTWRVWMHTRYVGPYIHLVFTVENK